MSVDPWFAKWVLRCAGDFLVLSASCVRVLADRTVEDRVDVSLDLNEACVTEVPEHQRLTGGDDFNHDLVEPFPNPLVANAKSATEV